MSKRSGSLKTFFSYLFLLLLVLFILFPLAWSVSTSLKPSGEIFSLTPKWIPENITFENFKNVLFDSSIPRYFVNSLLVGFLTTVLSLILGGAAGYGFARYQFKGNHTLSLFMLFSQMLPLIVMMIPFYLVMSKLHLLDTIFGLSVTHLVIAMPLVTWMSRSYFLSIPKELEEAALVDGCSHIDALLEVVLPLAAPGLAAAGLYAFVMSWNEFILASILTSTDKSQTLPIGITEFSSAFEVDWGSTMAASLIVTIPVILLFLWLQKYFVKGLTQGSVKG